MNNCAFDEADPLEKSTDARPDLYGVDGLEVPCEFVPVGYHALDGRCHGDLRSLHRRRLFPAAGSGEDENSGRGPAAGLNSDGG